MIELFKNMLLQMGVNADSHPKETLPISNTIVLTRITKKFIFRKREKIEFGIKYFVPDYFNMSENLPLQIIDFSKDLQVPAEVDLENRILYIGVAYQEEVDKFIEDLKNE